MTIMLLGHSPHELQHSTHHHYFNHHRMPTTPPALSMLQFLSMGSPQHQQHERSASPPPASSATATVTLDGSGNGSDNEVAQALEIARESPDGAKDPVVSGILEKALSQIWGRVQAQPESYVMTRDEFAVFNYFQHRFLGNKVAVAARGRFWDNTEV